MSALRALCRLLAVLAVCAGGPVCAQPADADEAPQISLLTFGPGEIYWQRFGHNALLVQTADGRADVYNYGIFDFHQQNFFLNFARGQMLYRLDRTPLLPTLRQYAAEGRWVVEQQLALDAGQRRALAEFLETNALPQNAEYRYDYFIANCSTRVRDALDHVLGGQLKAQLERQPVPISYRAEVLHLMAAEPALKLGMDLGLGAVVDAPLNQWQDGFIPMRLMASVRAARINVGAMDERSLMSLERELVRIPDVVPEYGLPPKPPVIDLLPFLFAGLAWAALLLLSVWLLPRSLFATLATIQVLVAGLGGLVLLLGWLATDHWGMARNLNLLLINPLWWLLLPAVLGQFRRQPRERRAWIPLGLGVVVLCALPALLLGGQPNAHWVVLLLPPQLILLTILYWRALLARP
ncbi:MAG TPA: DUF4105 domain-containing protein [Fontimonas sp.]